MRNTARFALGNLDGFNPARDSVAESEMPEMDRWALFELDAVLEKVREGYEAYEFHTVYHALYNFCTVTLSARYFDIIKDRLYTAAPRSPQRRSAQTALYKIADALARMLAPILVFTSDEIWENLPQAESEEARTASVHLTEFAPARSERDTELIERWTELFSVREMVLHVLEHERADKVIGSSLEARVNISASGATYDLLERYRDELRYLFIVSQVNVQRAGESPTENEPEIEVSVERAEGEKCERCWNYSTRVGESKRYPTACERCVEALSEIEREEAL
jgi:isoleucyl-tRNA synthetase